MMISIKRKKRIQNKTNSNKKKGPNLTKKIKWNKMLRDKIEKQTQLKNNSK